MGNLIKSMFGNSAESIKWKECYKWKSLALNELSQNSINATKWNHNNHRYGGVKRKREYSVLTRNNLITKHVSIFV